ncbi:MAG: HNH endonuclease [Pyrinomonadaceae bacterium]
MKFEEVSFDLDDKNLFLVDDLKLKADAIRHSIVPKIEIITNETISILTNVFDTDPLELNTILKFPNFRRKRNTEFTVDYPEAQAGLGPKRSRTLWTEVKRINDKHPMILPLSLTYCLGESGLCFYFTTTRYGISLKDYSLFHSYHLKYKEKIDMLVMESNTSLSITFEDYKKFALKPRKKLFDAMLNDNCWDIVYFSKMLEYPIDNESISNLVRDYVTFYPVYANYVKIASGNPFNFNHQLNLLRKYLIQYEESAIETSDEDVDQTETFSEQHLLAIAEKKIRVMPAMRWQVFQRDNWKCVACGRNSKNGVILHIDHIIPRSKGGMDKLDNYQTLCETCNIGKGNRDQTDLRTK